MTRVLFFEKPGCITNRRQKQLLESLGHTVEAHSLVKEAWTAKRLRSYFGTRPVGEWFNKTAPAIKSGEIDPGSLSEGEALTLMLARPLLIRRPLLEANGEKGAGFDCALALKLAGEDAGGPDGNEACSHPDGICAEIQP